MYVLRIAICAHGIRKVGLVMRIISQSGLLDVPYELLAISPYSKNVATIVGTFPGNDLGKGDRVYILAEYSSEEKAMKAMEMCREQYSQCEFNKLVIPKTDENLAKVSISLTGNAVNQIAEKYVFQFPADEEI
nr:MAG TPA: hypothetical protein [Caudoviricetes sp.]